MTLTEVKYEAIAHLKSRMTRDRLGVHDTPGTRWYVYMLENRIMGVCGLMSLSGGSCRIKAVWVPPDCRGRRIGSQMVDALIDIARARKCDCIEAYAYNEPFYLGRGFHRIGQRPNGAVRMYRGALQVE